MSLKSMASSGSLIRISPTLLSWTIYSPEVHTDLTSSLFLTSEGWWVIDPAEISKEVFESSLEKKPILGILLTNENHSRTAFALAKNLACFVYAHEATLGRMDHDPDCFFKDNEILKGDLKVIHIPGATAGESCFYDKNQRLVAVGDALINLKKTGFAFLPDQYCQDTVQSKKALRRLLDLEFDCMTFAHGEPLTLNARSRLQKLLATL